MRRYSRDGFTIVEMIVVIIVMAILLSLTLINLAGQQVISRDNERQQKAENIARGLERYYNEVAKPSVNVIGRYPDRATAVTDIVANSVLPGVESSSFIFTFNSSTSNFVVASDPTGTTPAEDAAAVTAINTLTTVNTVVYVPKTWSATNSRWEMCGTDEMCTRFSLFYRTEDSVLHEIASRRQE